jgi:branched-chain amino acid transport system ATP-binding protein
MSLLLRLTGVTKKFGGLTAVNNVSFDIDKGSVVGLIGPNGAGKTTVFNLITGNYTPTNGDVDFKGISVLREKRKIFNLLGLNGNGTLSKLIYRTIAPNKIVKMGIARTFQTIRLFQNMSVIENVLAGCHCRMKSGSISAMLRLPSQEKEEEKALKKAAETLDFVGLLHEAENLAKNLSYGQQRLLEIARALASDPELIILDEPAGGMNDQETSELVRLIGKIAENNITVLLIEHDMNLVMKACHKLIVLEYGTKIAEGVPEDIKNNKRVIEAYLGADEED